MAIASVLIVGIRSDNPATEGHFSSYNSFVRWMLLLELFIIGRNDVDCSSFGILISHEIYDKVSGRDTRKDFDGFVVEGVCAKSVILTVKKKSCFNIRIP